jgi:hypothetical protein
MNACQPVLEENVRVVHNAGAEFTATFCSCEDGDWAPDMPSLLLGAVIAAAIVVALRKVSP